MTIMYAGKIFLLIRFRISYFILILILSLLYTNAHHRYKAQND